MKCPKCGEEVTSVNVVSECWQKARVTPKGEIVDYGPIEEITDTVKVEHRGSSQNFCMADITKEIKEAK